MPPDFVKEVIDVFSKIKEEIDEKRGELDFRHSLANYLLKNMLGWGRKKGEGHYEIREREDIRLFNGQNRCVAIIETKNPKIVRLTDAHRSELKEHLDDYKGMAQYGALTNGHELKLFEYTGEGELNELASIDIDAFAGKGADALSKIERQKVHLLRRLRKDRFVEVSPEYFRKTAQTIKIEEPRNFDLFIEDLRGSLDELTRVIYERFFKFYWEAGPNHYGGKFLREEAFPRWKGASTGKEEELREKFCRETAYVILNRILFTRILEDKEIVKRMISAEEFAQSLRMFGEGAYEAALKQAYKNVEKFYEHFYEFGIFDWWRLPEDKLGMLTDEEKRIQKEIEDEFNTVVVRDILKRLNQFDFRKVGRDILGDVYQEYLPPAERKQLGEFYTPVEVVRYILDAVGYIPENRIDDKLLLDPACGSGTFLVEAAKQLAKRYEEKLKYPLQPDNARIIIEGIVNNVHGLDINPFACHISEMNLLFNLIDYLHAVHRKYRDYRLPRFNICCTDSLMPPELETAPITEYITNGRIRSYMEEAKRAKQVKKRQFDFVVGNPPYVRQERIKEIKKALLETYPEVYDGRADLYVYFYCQGIRWLNRQGKLGYISNNMFVRRGYGKKLTRYISNTCNTKIFTDFGDSGVFRDVTNYPCILIIERREGKEIPEYAYHVEVDRKPEGVSNKEILEIVKNTVLKDKEIKLEGFEVCKVKHPKPGETWAFIPIKREKILSKIESKSTGLLSEYRKEVLMGQQSNADRVHIVDLPVIEKYCLENELLKPLVRGEGIRRWRLQWGREYLIFPYKRVGKKDIVIPEDEIRKKYPQMWHYFNQKDNKKALESRHYLMEKIREGTRQEFYELWIPKKSQWFDNPKIMTPDISNVNNFTYDESRYYTPTTGFVIVLEDGMNDKFYYMYFLGLLNSNTLEFYFKHKSPFIGGKYFRYNKSYLEQLPIKLPQTNTEKRITDGIVNHVGQILQLNKQLDELEEKIEKFPGSYFSGETLVKAAEKCVLSKGKYNTKSLVIKPVKKTGKELYKLVLTKDDYVLFSSRAVAECALEQLKHKNKVRIDEIHELKVPSEKDASRIMDEFSSDKKRVEEIRKEVEKLEGEIDELVYELYGLDAKDQEVIEEFLKKF